MNEQKNIHEFLDELKEKGFDGDKFYKKLEDILGSYDIQASDDTDCPDGSLRLSIPVVGHWYNDGIGAYEYWGASGFDKGNDNFEVEGDNFDIDSCSKELLDTLGVEVSWNDPTDNETEGDVDHDEDGSRHLNTGIDTAVYPVYIADEEKALNFCKTLHEKKQLEEAIAYWERKLQALDEAEGSFKKIDDIVEYLADKDLKWVKVQKFQRIEATQSDGGEEIETVGSDGNSETTRTTKKGDWIVNNISNKDNKWIVDDKTFKKKYESVKDNVYKPKGGPMLAAPVSDCEDSGVEFAPPNWGGDTIKIENDGYFMKDPSNEKDIYAISKKDYDSTYKAEKDLKESRRHTRRQIKEAISFWERKLKERH